MLATWDSGAHPSQIRMKAYLAQLDAQLRPRLDGAEGALYVAIDAVVPAGRDLLHHYDLENYLTPVAHRLRDLPIVLASATKRITQGKSRVSIGSAQRGIEIENGWQSFSSVCAPGPAWKAKLRSDLLASGVTALAPGPVEAHLAWGCNQHARSWINLWKPTGDAMGPILGEPTPRYPYNPADDRIISLDLHLDRRDSNGYEFEVSMHWRLAEY